MSETAERILPWKCLFCRMATGLRVLRAPLCAICWEQVNDFIWVSFVQVVFLALGLWPRFATFHITMAHLSGHAPPNGTTTLVNAQAMLVSLSSVDLFIGPGTSVTIGNAFGGSSLQAGTLGFSVTGASLNLVTLTDLNNTAVTTDDISYIVIELADLDASLIGLEAILEFHAFDVNLALNQASHADGVTVVAKLDWLTFGANTTGIDLAH